MCRYGYRKRNTETVKCQLKQINNDFFRFKLNEMVFVLAQMPITHQTNWLTFLIRILFS